MYLNKLSPLLQIALNYESLLTPTLRSQFTDLETGEWEVILQHMGNIEGIASKVQMRYYVLNRYFAQIFINKQEVSILSDLGEVVYLSLPRRMEYIDIGLSSVCANNTLNPSFGFEVSGSGILLGVIDSGINYSHRDFRRLDGTTRIRYLWDQTIQGEPPNGFPNGTEYTEAEINEALQNEDRAMQLEVVPSQDILGHGTALAGIAGGNGAASRGNNRGIAPECEFVIVKMGKSEVNQQPRDIDVMQGITYVLEKAQEMDLPVVILIGVGENLTAHNGSSTLEIYIDQMHYTERSNFVVGVGNEGNRSSHTYDQVQDGETQSVQLLIEGDKRNYACSLWRSFSDEISIVLVTPTGERTESLSILTPNRAYLFGNTAVMINFTDSTVNKGLQEIFILFQDQSEVGISNGIWTLEITGDKVLRGDYNIWGSIVINPENRTGFLNAKSEGTLTSPATSRGVTSVAAFNGRTMQLAPFSGRGFVGEEVIPDLAAPGVSVTVPSGEGESEYTQISGTSAASAFVAGAYLVMLQYGIIKLANENLYGDALKIYLLRNTRRPSSYEPYPNISWGYGMLCIEAALNNMREVANSTV